MKYKIKVGGKKVKQWNHWKKQDRSDVVRRENGANILAGTTSKQY